MQDLFVNISKVLFQKFLLFIIQSSMKIISLYTCAGTINVIQWEFPVFSFSFLLDLAVPWELWICLKQLLFGFTPQMSQIYESGPWD